MKITKRLSEPDLALVYTRHYPWHQPLKSRYGAPKSRGKHTAVLGIGGNIGDTPRRFERLFYLLQHAPFVSLEQTAPILRNPAFGFAAQPDFYNSVIIIKTDLTPLHLLRYTQRIEKRFGRVRSFRNAPRTLDIDILFYDDLTMDSKALTIPHPGAMSRRSVLIPLQYMKLSL
jgi:2-amino-4-hydroxy-6-hydroxymethyldihydropteridine diphosphokinase